MPRAERRASQRRTSSGTAEQTLVGQGAKGAGFTQHNVVQDADADEFAHLAEALGKSEVFRRRRGIATRMVVDVLWPPPICGRERRSLETHIASITGLAT